MNKYIITIVFEDAGQACASDRMNTHIVYAFDETSAAEAALDIYWTHGAGYPTIRGLVFTKTFDRE
jgi:hypothetical protein